jgi:hypothetical protein
LFSVFLVFFSISNFYFTSQYHQFLLSHPAAAAAAAFFSHTLSSSSSSHIPQCSSSLYMYALYLLHTLYNVLSIKVSDNNVWKGYMLRKGYEVTTNVRRGYEISYEINRDNLLWCVVMHYGKMPRATLGSRDLRSHSARVRTKNKCLGEGLFLTVNSILSTRKIDWRHPACLWRHWEVWRYHRSIDKWKGYKLRTRYEVTKKVWKGYEEVTK